METAIKGNLLNALAVFDEHTAGVAYAYFGQKLHVGFLSTVFKVSAKIRYRHIGYSGSFLNQNLAIEMRQRKFVDMVNGIGAKSMVGFHKSLTAQKTYLC